MLAKLLLKISFVFLLGFSSFAASPESTFEAANKAYDNQQYDSSYVLYSSILDQGWVSVELYKNIGTAAYKLDKTPEAVYYFEKGLKLNPGNDDLAHNLKLANQKVIDKSPVTSGTGISNWLSYTLGGNADLWATYAVIFAIVGGLFILAYLFLKTSNLKRIGLIGGISIWVISLLFVGVSFLQYNISSSNDFGILFDPSIEVRNDPSEAASVAFVLHEGSKLRILDENKHWYKISFGDDKVGWLPKESLKII